MPHTRVKNVLSLSVALLIGGAGLALAQDRGGAPPAAQNGGMGTMLMEGLRSTPGCLGVDAGQFQSGKNAIIAWFENKEAAKRWYDSPVHQRMMGMMAQVPGAAKDEPMAHVPDNVPLMVVASITFTEQPEIEGIPMPISQIAIELYTPVAGGAEINGRLAPESLRVEHMQSYRPGG